MFKVLTGSLLSAVTGGSLGAIVAILSGHPPLVTLMFYSLSGICAVLAFLCHALAAPQRIRQGG